MTEPNGDTQLAELLRDSMPLSMPGLTIAEAGTGLVIIDEVNGFASVGGGNMAPPVENPLVTSMIAETDRLARAFAAQGWPILATLDTHEPGKPEPPYPPHCEKGTGEENFVPVLEWLEDEPLVTLLRKDCINAFVGAIGEDGRNVIVDWVNTNRLKRLLVVGICTDICVMDFVLTSLSARNHGMTPTLEDIAVHSGGCATYDLPREAATGLGLPDTAAHPGQTTHYLGLYFMASRGALLTDSVEVAAQAATQ